MLETNKSSLYKIILLIILLLAVFTRFEKLGKMPLSNQEAIPALSALDNITFHSVNSENQPIYIFLTSILFDFFEDNNFTARLFPALAGIALIIIINSFGQKIGRKKVLLLSLIMVFDPVFLALSRQADSRIFLLLFLISIIAFLFIKKYVIVGICLACLALSGVYFWHLVTIGLLFGLFVFYVNRKQEKSSSLIFIVKENSKIIGSSFLITFVIVCFGLFSTPFMFDSFIQSFVKYLGGWMKLSDVFKHAPQIIIILFSGFPLYLLAGLYEGIQSLRIKKIRPRYLFSLFFITSIITLSYPLAQRIDVIFILPFLIYGLVIYMLRLCDRLKTNLTMSTLIAIPIVILLCLVWLLSLHQLNINMGESEIRQLFVLFIGFIFVFCLIIILSSWGWSTSSTFMGLNIAVLLVFGMFHLSLPLHLLDSSSNPESEVWWIGNYFKDADIIKKVVKNISITSGLNESLEIYSDHISLPSLVWLFRNYELKALDMFPRNSSPSIIFTKNIELPSVFHDKYYGNTFNIEAGSAWMLNFPRRFIINDYFNWLLIRKNEIQTTEYYYWVHKGLLSSDNTKSDVIEQDNT